MPGGTNRGFIKREYKLRLAGEEPKFFIKEFQRRPASLNEERGCPFEDTLFQ